MGFKNTREIIRVAKDSGSHFFDPGTMRFFGSRVERGVYGEDGRVFITSEQDPEGIVYDGQRRYFPREAYSGPVMLMIDRIGPDDGFSTLEEARAWVKAHITA